MEKKVASEDRTKQNWSKSNLSRLVLWEEEKIRFTIDVIFFTRLSRRNSGLLWLKHWRGCLFTELGYRVGFRFGFSIRIFELGFFWRVTFGGVSNKFSVVLHIQLKRSWRASMIPVVRKYYFLSFYSFALTERSLRDFPPTKNKKGRFFENFFQCRLNLYNTPLPHEDIS